MRRRKKSDHPAYSLLPPNETPGYPEAGQAEASSRSVAAREPISLDALRQAWIAEGGGILLVDEVLALIDAVEAAQRVQDVLSNTPEAWRTHARDRRLAGYLAPALERFTP